MFFHNECLIPDCNLEKYNYYPWLFRKEVKEGERPVFFYTQYQKTIDDDIDIVWGWTQVVLDSALLYVDVCVF